MTDFRPLDDLYIEWLYRKIGVVGNRNPRRSYWNMARQMYGRKFEWFVHNDDNRAEDGKCLRDEFIDEEGLEQVDPMWLDLECSMLEMLVALAGRVAFESNSDSVTWFGVFLKNMGISQYTDAEYSEDDEEGFMAINNAMDRIIYRSYKRNGDGGLFPLRNASKDQRKVELWYQMSMYLLESDYIDHGP